MKKILFLFGLFSTLAFLASCEDSTIPVPTNVRIEDETMLIWDAVAGAEAYIVEVGTHSIEDITTTSQDLTVFHDILPDGTYEVKVAATLGDFVTDFSAAVSYTIDTTINAVSNLAIQDDMLTWDAVADATSYRVSILGQTFSVTTPSFDLTQMTDLPMEMLQLSVVAMVGTDASMPVTITYDYTMGGMEPMLFMLRMVNESYDMYMDEADFETEEDYQDYVMTKGMIESYMSYTDGQSPMDAAMMFGMAQSLESDEMTMDPMSLFDIFDDAESMDGQTIANLLISYLLSMSEMNQEYNDMYLELFNEQLLELNAEYQTFVSEGGVMFEMAEVFAPYMLDADFERLFTSLDMPLYDLDYKFSVIFETWYSLDAGYGLPEYDETEIELIQQAVLNAYQANDEAFRTFVLDETTNFMLMEYGELIWFYFYTLDEIEYFTMGQTDPVIALIESDREALEMSLAVLFDYILDVRTAIETPLNNIQTMLNSGTATNAQIVSVKDQVVYAVYENLPDSELLVEAMNVIFMIIYGQMDLDPGAAQADAEIFVPRFLLTMEAFAEFMYMIDEADVEELLTLLDALMVSESVDPAIDLLVWGAGHILAFEAAFPAIVAELEANQLFFLDVSLITDALGMMTDLESLEVILNDLLAVQQPLIKDYMEVFVETEGALFKDLNALTMGTGGIDVIVDGLLPYVHATTENLVTEEMESLVANVLELLAPELAVGFGLSEAEAMNLVASITGDVNELLAAFLIVGEVLIESAAEVSLDDAMVSEDMLFLAVLDILALMFVDPTFETSYVNVFEGLDRILNKPEVLALTMMTAEEVQMILTDLDMMLTDLIDMVTLAAAIDPETMTEEEEQLLMELFEMFAALLAPTEEPFPEPVMVDATYDAVNETIVITNSDAVAYELDIYIYDEDFNFIEHSTLSLPALDSKTIAFSAGLTYYYVEVVINDVSGYYLDFIDFEIN